MEASAPYVVSLNTPTALAAFGTGILVAHSTFDLSKTFVSCLVMPLLHAARTFKATTVHVSTFVAAALTFGLTILIALLMVKAFRLQKRPIALMTPLLVDPKQA